MLRPKTFPVGPGGTADAAQVLFPLTRPIGESIVVGSTRFTVIGVLEGVGREASPIGIPLDLCVFVPLTTSRARFGDEIRKRSVRARSARASSCTR